MGYGEDVSQLAENVDALRREIEALKGVRNKVVLTSPSGKFHIEMELSDNGLLRWVLFTRESDGCYKKHPGDLKIAQARERPHAESTESIWYLG